MEDEYKENDNKSFLAKPNVADGAENPLAEDFQAKLSNLNEFLKFVIENDHSNHLPELEEHVKNIKGLLESLLNEEFNLKFQIFTEIQTSEYIQDSILCTRALLPYMSIEFVQEFVFLITHLTAKLSSIHSIKLDVLSQDFVLEAFSSIIANQIPENIFIRILIISKNLLDIASSFESVSSVLTLEFYTNLVQNVTNFSESARHEIASNVVMILYVFLYRIHLYQEIFPISLIIEEYLEYSLEKHYNISFISSIWTQCIASQAIEINEELAKFICCRIEQMYQPFENDVASLDSNQKNSLHELIILLSQVARSNLLPVGIDIDFVVHLLEYSDGETFKSATLLIFDIIREYNTNEVAAFLLEESIRIYGKCFEKKLYIAYAISEIINYLCQECLEIFFRIEIIHIITDGLACDDESKKESFIESLVKLDVYATVNQQTDTFGQWLNEEDIKEKITDFLDDEENDDFFKAINDIASKYYQE